MIQKMPDRAMVVCAHPDDMEYYCGGTVLALTRNGCEVHAVIATDGNRGSLNPDVSPEALARLRREEARKSAQILGVGAITFLGISDGEVVPDLTLRSRLARLYREHTPALLLTFDPWKRYELHPDHRAVGTAALDARLAARLPLYFPEHLRDGLGTWSIREILLFNTDQPDHFFDVSETFEGKIAALAVHRSQWSEIQIDVESALAREARQTGARAGYALAEAFKRILIPGVTVSSYGWGMEGDPR
ncbi:MAG: PIG-L family deacetylase [Firmicutes bacterium]|jgi:LmbE family N-acetylglucosaminyl deacetylase|nr:PIG-L family deacetylase [Bacillota bacterium]